ncbi:replication protein RepA [Hyphomicrobium sp. DY-1]|uniref:replication protein RepA n=1 Tax=Hyphomicrobium sp. DY-1 TaxID=3075650 RepID=UPI0039C483B2
MNLRKALITTPTDEGDGVARIGLLPVDGIRDADLLKKLDQTAPLIREFEMRRLQEEQARRDQLRTLPRDQRRRAETQHLLTEGKGAERDSLRHIHSVLAMCSLPYKATPDPTWERTQGQMKLKITAGELMNPNTGEWEQQTLPYGSRARLILMHLSSQAILHNSPEIDIEKSLTGFIRSMGIAVTGGKQGSIHAFKQQINALAACSMKIGLFAGDKEKARTISTQPFTSLDIWLPASSKQKILWPEKIVFSQEFYNTLKKHALPVNLHAVRAFAGSPRKLDIYFWLTYRFNSIAEAKHISWDALKEQFGIGYTRDRKFRADFTEEIKQIKEVFPKLPVLLSEKGFTIQPGAAEVMAIPLKPRK